MKGNPLPDLVKDPINREQLKAYAEASGDNNPIHLDEETAKKSGLPGVIAHGMLTMAFMGEFLHQALAHIIAKSGASSGWIGEMSCRFKAMTFPGDVITVHGTSIETEKGHFQCELEARNQKGELTATGHGELVIKS